MVMTRSGTRIISQAVNPYQEISLEARIIRVTSPAGTNLTKRVDKAVDPFFSPPPKEGWYVLMLAGQAGFLTIQQSSEGTLVFDGCISPLEDIGVLHSPVILHIERGVIDNIEGGS